MRLQHFALRHFRPQHTCPAAQAPPRWLHLHSLAPFPAAPKPLPSPAQKSKSTPRIHTPNHAGKTSQLTHPPFPSQRVRLNCSSIFSARPRRAAFFFHPGAFSISSALRITPIDSVSLSVLSTSLFSSVASFSSFALSEPIAFCALHWPLQSCPWWPAGLDLVHLVAVRDAIQLRRQMRIRISRNSVACCGSHRDEHHAGNKAGQFAPSQMPTPRLVNSLQSHG